MWTKLLEEREPLSPTSEGDPPASMVRPPPHDVTLDSPLVSVDVAPASASYQERDSGEIRRLLLADEGRDVSGVSTAATGGDRRDVFGME